jgi:hypothetical protein
MTKYRFQVCLDRGTDKERWEDVYPHGSGGQPYEYDTWAEAEKMAYICYGRDPQIVRVREVEQ